MTDHNLRDIASRCEAKLHGFRRTADGVVVSFVVSPIDVPPALALDPLGTRYMLAFVAISDDETPIPGRHSPDGPTAALLDGSARLRELTSAALTPKARYAAMTAGEQAVQRAGMLPQDARFRAWATEQRHGDLTYLFDETEAADYIRDICCGGSSRSRIAENPEAMDRFIDLETRFLIDVGQITGPR